MKKRFGAVVVVAAWAALAGVPCAFGAQVWVVSVLEQSSGKYSRCKAISEDGQWVVGLSYKSGVAWPFYWSKSLGIQDMGNPGGSSADVTGCTVDVPGFPIACGNIGGLGRRWYVGTWTILPANPAQTSGNPRSVYAITYDQSTTQEWIVGSSYPDENWKAYRYNCSNGSFIDYWGYYQDAYGVAHNGWAVGKNNFGNYYDGSEPWNYRYEHAIFIFDWTMNCAGGGNCGWDQIPRFSGYGDDQYFKSRATAIGVNAHWAAGYMTYNPADLTQYHAFKWQVPTNPQPAPTPWIYWARPIDLGTLSGDNLSYAYCVSDSTTNPVIGGTSYSSSTGNRAVYWDNAGIHNLYTTLQGLGVDMSRWTSLGKVLGISANGVIMVGSGLYDDDNNPSTAAIEMGFYVDLVDNTPQPPMITMDPASQVGCTGGASSFTVAATGSGNLLYQWQQNQVNLSNGGHFSGVTTPTLTISNMDLTDAANYRCVVSNLGGSTNSNEAGLTVASVSPATPTDGTPTADASDKITWKWTDVADENGYRVKDTSGTVQSGDLPAATVQWQENALAANTQHTRRIYAFNACGESAGSTGQSKYTLVLAPTYGTDTATPTVSCDRGASAAGLDPSAYVTFTATNGFGDGYNKVGQFGYLWDTAAVNPTSWTGEQLWTGGTLVRQVGATVGTSRYLHLRAYNNAIPMVLNTTVLNLGPYTVGGTGYTCLRNPGFEDGFTSGVGNYWTKFNYAGNVTCSDDTTQYHSGAHSQKVYSASSSNEGGIYQRFDVTPGLNYTVTIWYKCSSTQVAAYIGIDPNGGTNPNIGVNWHSLSGTTSWTQASANQVAAGTVMTVYLDVVAAPAAGSVWFDDATPACSSVPPAPIDGTPVALSTTSIRWVWGDVSGETGYRVKTTTGTVVSPDLAANVTQWDETTGISANTQYSRKIYAFNASGESAGSTGQSRYSLIETPTGVGFGTITTNSIAASPSGTLSNLSAGSSGVRTSNTTAGTNSGWQTSQGAWTSADLAPNTQYAFVARARNGNGVETNDSPTAAAWTLSTAPGETNVTTGSWSPCTGDDVEWTAVQGFGPGTVQYYRYAWDQSSTHSWTDSEPTWSGGTLITTPTSDGTWYLHLKGYNGADVANGTYDYSVTTGVHVGVDFDNDCDVDEVDYGLFAACFSGPAVSYATECADKDLDTDGDVDQEDFARFQRCFSGKGPSPDPQCLE